MIVESLHPQLRLKQPQLRLATVTGTGRKRKRKESDALPPLPPAAAAVTPHILSVHVGAAVAIKSCLPLAPTNLGRPQPRSATPEPPGSPSSSRLDQNRDR